MPRNPRHPPLWFLAAAVATVALAALQWSWTGRLSDEEERSRRELLHAKLNQLGDEFDRDLHSLHRALCGDRPVGIWDPQDWTEALQQWRGNARFPEILGDVYACLPVDAGSRRLQVREIGAESWRSTDWPSHLLPWATALEEHTPLELLDDAEHWDELSRRAPALIVPFEVADARDGGAVFSAADGALSDALGLLFVPLCGPGGERAIGSALRREWSIGQADGFELEFVRVGAAGRADSVARCGKLLWGRVREQGDLRAAEYRQPLDECEKRQVSMRVVHARSPSAGGLDGPELDELTEFARGDHEEPMAPAFELRARHRSGSLAGLVRKHRWQNLATSGAILGLLIFAIHRARRAARAERRLVERKFAFVAGVAHELRTPLSVLRAASENLADGVVRDPAKVHEHATLIRDRTVGLSDLVERVLDGTTEPARADADESCSLAAVLDRVLDDLESQVRARSATVRLPSPAELEMPPVAVPASALHSVLRNVLENALRYGGEQPRVQLRLRRRNRTSWDCSIEDRGPGVPADEIGLLGEPCFRGRAHRGTPGHGLGLAWTKAVLESRGGEMSVRPRRGGGTCVTLTLPVRGSGS